MKRNFSSIRDHSMAEYLRKYMALRSQIFFPKGTPMGIAKIIKITVDKIYEKRIATEIFFYKKLNLFKLFNVLLIFLRRKFGLVVICGLFYNFQLVLKLDIRIVFFSQKIFITKWQEIILVNKFTGHVVVIHYMHCSKSELSIHKSNRWIWAIS